MKNLGSLLMILPFVFSCSTEKKPDVINQIPSEGKVISKAEFDQLLAEKKLFLESDGSISAENYDELIRSRKETINSFLKDKPDVKFKLEQAVLDDRLKKIDDGNYEFEIKNNLNESIKVVTMGDNWRIGEFSDGIIEFPILENQNGLYEFLISETPESIIQQLELPGLKELSTLNSEALKNANNTITNLWRDIYQEINLIPVIPGKKPEACSDEFGAGSGFDQWRNASSCSGFSSKGIYQNYNFPNKDFLTCVKDQANRGSCVSFSITSAIESLVSKKYNLWTNLSEQTLYNQMKFIWNRDDNRDGFLTTEAVSKMVQFRFNAPFEFQWNYNPSISRAVDSTTRRYTGSCTRYRETCSETSHQSERVCVAEPGMAPLCGYLVPNVNPYNNGFRISKSLSLWDAGDTNSSFARVATAVALKSPVLWSFGVTTGFDRIDSNGYVTYNPGEGDRGGHSVHIVGLILNETLASILPDAPAGSGGGYFIIKNSWGSCWGDGGFVYIPFDFVKNYTYNAVMILEVK